MNLYLENVRSFVGRHSLPIAPLTFLVGENSSGKSTVLAMLSALLSETGFPIRPRFNDPPFELGGYETIATHRGGTAGRAKHFALGFTESGEAGDVVATYSDSLGQPVLTHLLIKQSGGVVEATLNRDGGKGRLVLHRSGHDKPDEFTLDPNRLLPQFNFGSLRSVMTYLYMSVPSDEEENFKSGHLLQVLMRTAGHMPQYQSVAVAPVRTKPKRTYDPISDEFRPEGDHIPLVLARALSSTSKSPVREGLRRALIDFGEDSGLFTEVKVRNLGKGTSDPFQVLVAVAGRPFNLLDVGYGVSQALPVVVESVLSNVPRTLLLQQPEVHLHPRAQAALGSLFVKLASQRTRFVVETHSDYLIDRVRQEIGVGRIDSKLVNVMFFERKQGRTKAHPLVFDPQGNIVGAPPSYRGFFLSEEEATLRRKTVK